MSTRARQRRGIDMLPLLDVFMVVLFVFATIQEQKLDTSTQELDRLNALVAAQQLELARYEAATPEPAEVEAERARELAEAEARAQLEQRVDEHEQKLLEYEQACGAPARPPGPICPAAQTPNRVLVERQDQTDRLLDRLIDNIAVFEIELQGQPDYDTGKLRNLCCYRSDPPEGEWKSCGEVPTGLDERATWLDDGGEGLIEALSRTRGGQAIVMVRQRGLTRYRLTNDLTEQLRDRLHDHKIYDDGSVAGPPSCPMLPR